MSEYSPAAFAAQLEVIYDREPDALVVGSLGRAVLHNAAHGDPFTEYNRRGQDPLNKGFEARDIDLLGTPKGMFDDTAPFEIDDTAFNSSEVAIVRDGQDWWLTSEERNFAEQLHPDVLQPVRGETVYGVACATVPAQTHLALYHARPILRLQDKVTSTLLEQTITSTNSLPDELYQPFDALRQARTSKLMVLSDVYNAFVPPSVDRYLQPIIGGTRARLARLDNRLRRK